MDGRSAYRKPWWEGWLPLRFPSRALRTLAGVAASAGSALFVSRATYWFFRMVFQVRLGRLTFWFLDILLAAGLAVLAARLWSRWSWVFAAVLLAVASWFEFARAPAVREVPHQLQGMRAVEDFVFVQGEASHLTGVALAVTGLIVLARAYLVSRRARHAPGGQGAA